MAVAITEWTNWAGNVRAAPRVIARPASLAALREAVVAAARRGETVRVAGAGHSFAPLCATTGTLLDLSLLSGIERVDPVTGEATVWAGTRLHDLGVPLQAAGRGLANQGDIDRQAIAGAVGTGTHGSGRKHGSFSAMVRAVELMTADGELVTIDAGDPSRLRAAALSLGLLGVMTRLTLATVPAYKLRERNAAYPLEETLTLFLDEEQTRRTAEFWWLPAHDVCVLKSLDDTDEEPFQIEQPEAPPGSLARYLKPDRVDWSWRSYPSTRSFPFVEMEYTLPLAAGPDAMRAVRRVMQARHPECTWAVEYRTMAGEQSLLSPTQGAESVTISVHQAADLPYESLFRDVETIFLASGGHPHWGKLHGLGRHDLERLYPDLDAFRGIQTGLDPGGVFVNDYLTTLGVAAGRSAPAR